MEDSKGNNWSLTSPDRTNHSSKQVDVQPACRMRNGGVESLNLVSNVRALVPGFDRAPDCQALSIQSDHHGSEPRHAYGVYSFRTNWRYSIRDRNADMSQEPCLCLNWRLCWLLLNTHDCVCILRSNSIGLSSCYVLSHPDYHGTCQDSTACGLYCVCLSDSLGSSHSAAYHLSSDMIVILRAGHSTTGWGYTVYQAHHLVEHDSR